MEALSGASPLFQCLKANSFSKSLQEINRSETRVQVPSKVRFPSGLGILAVKQGILGLPKGVRSMHMHMYANTPPRTR
jgi:hypothetical protein